MIVDNMQAVHECKDAAHDYAALQCQHLAELKLLTAERGIFPEDTDLNDDPVRFAAMQAAPEISLEIQDSDIDVFSNYSDHSKQEVLLCSDVTVIYIHDL